MEHKPNRAKIAATMALIIVLVYLGAWISTTSHESLEYKVFQVPEFGGPSRDDHLQSWLNDRGRDGWHLPSMEIFMQQGRAHVHPLGVDRPVYEIVAWRTR